MRILLIICFAFIPLNFLSEVRPGTHLQYFLMFGHVFLLLVMLWSLFRLIGSPRAQSRVSIYAGIFALPLALLALRLGVETRISRFRTVAETYTRCAFELIAQCPPGRMQRVNARSSCFDADAIRVQRAPDGSGTVVLVVSYGLPAAHHGFVFRADDAIEGWEERANWSQQFRRVCPYWFAF